MAAIDMLDSIEVHVERHVMPAPVLDIFVPGDVVQMMAQGSKDPHGGESGDRALRSKVTGEVTRKAGELSRWRKLVSRVARDAWDGQPPLNEAVAISYEFIFERGSAPLWKYWKDTKPDCDKLQRAINDSLARPSKTPGPRVKEWVGAGVLYDDSRVALPVAPRRYTRRGEAAGVHIQVYPLRDLERRGLRMAAPFVLLPIAPPAGAIDAGDDPEPIW